jgi:TolB-like protein
MQTRGLMKGNFTTATVKEQLDRILAFPAFKNSGILTSFLQFVIDETLAGRERDIKEYSIGIKVLTRNADFNPQLDAIVRIHAGRLRRALKEYYYEQGADDPIIIEIPKGSYVPVFQSRSDKAAENIDKIKAARKKPVIAVYPFRNISEDRSRDFFADGLGEQLSTELAWFQDLSVISYYSSRHVAGITSDVKEAARLLGTKYVLTGSVQSDGTNLRIRAQLISGESGEQLWTKSFEQNKTASGLFEIQNAIVKNILIALGGYYGVIFRDVLKAPYSSITDGIEIYDALFWYYHYQKVSSKDVMQKTIAALESAVKADPDYALAWAMLAELYLDEKVLEFKNVDNQAEEGLKCALRAIRIDPNCQHAYLALTWIYLILHNREECLKAIEQCLAINPNSSDMKGAMGFALICLGEFESGVAYLQECIQNNPYCPWWFKAGFVLYYLNKKDYQQAWYWADRINVPEMLWDPLLKAAVLGHLSRKEEAGSYLKVVTGLVPDAVNQIRATTEAIILSEDLVNQIQEGLKRAGLHDDARITNRP